MRKPAGVVKRTLSLQISTSQQKTSERKFFVDYSSGRPMGLAPMMTGPQPVVLLLHYGLHEYLHLIYIMMNKHMAIRTKPNEV